MDPLIESLRAIVGRDHCVTRADDMAPWLTDWRGRYTGAARAVVLPTDVSEVSAVVRACAASGVPMVPQGGNTGLCGGATPLPDGASVVVQMSRLNRLRAVDPANNTLTAEAGCTLAAVQQAALDADRFFPLSLASEGSCEIGGVLSTNAGGVQVLRYGNARELALGLEVVLPSGEIWHGLRGLRKDNTGYDLKQLFIGAEGTLGFITAATLKLFARPRASATAWLAVRDPEAAVALLARLRGAAGDRLTAFELVGRPCIDFVLRHVPGSRDPLPDAHPWYVLVEFTDTLPGADLAGLLEAVLAAALEERLAEDGVIAASEAQAQALWALRENISEAQKREGISLKHDVSLPVSAIPVFLREAENLLQQASPGVRIVAFGHLGDGNLHYNLSRPIAADNADFIAHGEAMSLLVHDLVARTGGSISAEHGIGQLKRLALPRYKSPIEMQLMRGIKDLLDPQSLMNPGKMVSR